MQPTRKWTSSDATSEYSMPVISPPITVSRKKPMVEFAFQWLVPR